jgi:hypothetical protein
VVSVSTSVLVFCAVHAVNTSKGNLNDFFGLYFSFVGFCL